MLKSSHYTWVAKNTLTVNYLDVISRDCFPPKWVANHSFTPNTLCNFGVRINSCKNFARQVIHFRQRNVFSPSHLQRGPLLRREVSCLMTTRALSFVNKFLVENNNSILSGELKSFGFWAQQAILSNALIRGLCLGTWLIGPDTTVGSN